MADYYQLLAPLAATVQVWQTKYLHVLSGPDPVKEWFKGSSLRPLLDALDGTESLAFEADYAERMRMAYPPMPDGRTLFPMQRLFLIATRS